MSGNLQAGFIEYICQRDTVKVFLAQVKNRQIRYGLYKNTARAFNYILGQTLANLFESGLLPKDDYMLHIDERNQKTGTTHSLEDDSVIVKYYDSAQNSLIQVADVFSNAYYKHCMQGGSAEYISPMLNAKATEGYFPAVYQFPQKIIKITGTS